MQEWFRIDLAALHGKIEFVELLRVHLNSSKLDALKVPLKALVLKDCVIEEPLLHNSSVIVPAVNLVLAGMISTQEILSNVMRNNSSPTEWI